jgi:hypothetical protein
VASQIAQLCFSFAMQFNAIGQEFIFVASPAIGLFSFFLYSRV